MNPQFTKDMQTKFESVDDKGTIIAKSSSYGNTDVYGDVFQRGAFDNDIARISKDNKIPMLFNHSQDEVVGSWYKMWDDNNFVYTEGRLSLGIRRADELHIMLKNKDISGVSIGFNSEDHEEIKDEKGGYTGMLFKQVNTLESSIVVFPANPKAGVNSVKSVMKTEREFENFLRDAGGFSREQAKAIVAGGYRSYAEKFSKSGLRDAESEQLVLEALRAFDPLKI